MTRLVECVPNFSEGRRPEVVDGIAAVITSVAGVRLLDREMDKSHNRAVLTFVGEPDAVRAAAFDACAKATELINLEEHRGEHPRMGATDVIPFVPVAGVTMEECVRLARELGAMIAERLHIPVYLYAAAATRPEREDLAKVREGEFEGLRTLIQTDPARRPDFGEARIHPTAGAVAVGARMPLIAYNVNLGTTDVRVAKQIARAVRGRDGGLRYVKALGFSLEDRGLVQVSMNLTDSRGTPIHRAFELIKREAERYGVPVVESEIVGLVNLEAIAETAAYFLQLAGFDRTQILEDKVWGSQEGAASCQDFLGAVAASTPTPGGGSVAALSGAAGLGLGAMACGITVKDKQYEAVRPEFESALHAAEVLRARLTGLIDEDAEAFRAVLRARKMPKGTEPEQHARAAAIEAAWQHAASVPLTVVQSCRQGLDILLLCADRGSAKVLADVGVAVFQLDAAIKGAGLNVEMNLRSIQDEGFRSHCREALAAAQAEAATLVDQAMRTVQARLAG
ncbi:MAG: glutamate formimidoyltransferase [Candidatus Latescibacteria bacterium]|nr:glutamate formimidoyltransferase [Candidatus Latescibacterota bacterium]